MMITNTMIMVKSNTKRFNIYIKKIKQFIKDILICETPEERIYKEQWNNRLREITNKMKK